MNLTMIDTKDPFRFLSRITIDKNTGCWLWANENNSRYGLHFCKKTRRCTGAHRYSYLVFKGEIKEGMYIDHLCMVKRCVNPDHLRQVTPRINAIENNSSPAYMSSKKTHCINGHEFTDLNTYKRGFQRHCRSCRIKATEKFLSKKKVAV